MRILIHHDDASAWRKALTTRMPGAVFAVSGEDDRFQADYLVAWRPSAGLLEQQKALKGIINLGAGVDALLDNPARPRRVPIVRLRDAGMSAPIADYCRYGVLYFQRDFDRYQRQQAVMAWQPAAVTAKRDWTVGVLGLGAIGQPVAQAIAADGYPVHGWSRSPKTIDGLTCHHGDAGLMAMLGKLRTLITLLPATPATRHLINTRTLAALPAGASLINPGRGALIDAAALLDALGSGMPEGRLRGALLDVFPEEPLAPDSPLWRHPRIRITPHVAGPTPVGEAADQVAAALCALDAGAPVDIVDPQAGY